MKCTRSGSTLAVLATANRNTTISQIDTRELLIFVVRTEALEDYSHKLGAVCDVIKQRCKTKQSRRANPPESLDAQHAWEVSLDVSLVRLL